jgi:hypothetical protein
LLGRTSKNRTNLEVSELREELAAVVESAGVGFGLIVDGLVDADIAALCEFLAADIACMWLFTSMAPLVGL